MESEFHPKTKEEGVSHCWGQSEGEISHDNDMVPVGTTFVIVIVTIFIEYLLCIRHYVNRFFKLFYNYSAN